MIYQYADYRSWLDAELKTRTQDNPLYSGNAFAKKLGFSQSYWSLILGKKRALTEKAALMIAEKLKLSPPEIEYLLLMIKKEKTKDLVVKKYLTSEISKFRRLNKVDELNLEKFKVISDWYYSALLELITIKNISHTPKALAERLNIDVETLTEALERLEYLELIKKEKNRFVRRDSGNLATPTEMASQGLKNFHKQIMQKSVKALQDQPIQDRVFSGMTMAIDPEKLPEAKKMIEDFKHNLSALLESGTQTKVYQLSLQLFQLDQQPKENHEN